MLDPETRTLIMERLGEAVDGVVRELYDAGDTGPLVVQEPEITSRICESVEIRLNGQRVGDYLFQVTAQSMPDRGPGSLESKTGADLVLAVSLDGPDGFNKTVFVQSKYDHTFDREEVLDACRRMEKYVGREGGYVWIYGKDGVRVLSSHQVAHLPGDALEQVQSRSVKGLTGRILDCHAGSQAWGIPPGANRRKALWERLREARAANGLYVVLEGDKP